VYRRAKQPGELIGPKVEVYVRRTYEPDADHEDEICNPDDS
jgi:hypothetical protein